MKPFKVKSSDLKIEPLEFPDYDLDRDYPKPARKKRKGLSPEWKLQAQCVKAIKARQVYDKNLRFIANMPEGQRDAKRAGIAKMMGLQSGIADIILLKRWGSTPNLCFDWIEIKREDGKVSPAQKDWMLWFEGSVMHCHVVRDLATFIKILEA